MRTGIAIWHIDANVSTNPESRSQSAAWKTS